MNHDKLVDIGGRWLKNHCSCSIILKELTTYTKYGEIPDVLGFTSCFSFMIECKMSRADFFADKKKSFRQYEEFGMGQFRFIMCPAGLIQPYEIYHGWGLLWTRGNRVYQQNCKVTSSTQMGVDKFNSNLDDERSMLVSVIRRMNEFKPVMNNGPKITKDTGK